MQEYTGYRTKQRRKKQRKKKRLIRLLIGAFLVVVMLALLGWAFDIHPFDKGINAISSALRGVRRSISGLFKIGRRNKPFEFLPEGKKTANYLVAVTKFVGGKRLLPTLVLISYDSRDKSASVIYFPSYLEVDVPGAGEEVVSNLVETDGGRMGMCIAAVSNLMGVDIDRFLLLSDLDLRKILARLNDQYEIKVEKSMKIDDKSLKVKAVIKPGLQKMSPDKLTAYLTYCDEGQERSLIQRQTDFLPEFLGISSKSQIFNKALEIVKSVIERIETDAKTKEIAGFWQNLSLVKDTKLAQVSVPEKRVSIEDTVIHILDRKEINDFREKYVKSDYSLAGRFRIEILNGCREPGIGLDVISRISTERFSVVNSGNADNFDYTETIIRVYSQDKKILDAAESIKKAISVGKIEYTPGAQDLIDITVVVGNDCVKKHKNPKLGTNGG